MMVGIYNSSDEEKYYYTKGMLCMPNARLGSGSSPRLFWFVVYSLLYVQYGTIHHTCIDGVGGRRGVKECIVVVLYDR